MTAATTQSDASNGALQNTGAPDDVEADPQALMDVWSRSGSKYRIRAVVLLAINVLLFAGLGSFAYWLRSGERFAPALDGYWDEVAQTLHFGQHTSVSLASFMIEPISVQNVPMQIPILGLLMAALISIPILVSILYRFWSSIPFIAVVGFLAVMPWLAITLLGSCIIASVRPFRARLRFMAALLGLVPTVVYLVLAWRGSSEILLGGIDPIDTIKFVAPWVMAIVAAALVFAIVLTLANVVNYRPGAITPLLAIMFGLPVALFEFHVGRDELYYRLLERLNAAHFADIDASLALEEAVNAAWGRHPSPRPKRSVLRKSQEIKWQFELATDLGPHRSEVTRHQEELAARCDWFHKHFPDSPYAPNALYIKARALDMRVDPVEFRNTRWIRFYADFPAAASSLAWRKLAEHDPDSILAATALLRLSQLDARNGDVERAISRLEELTTRFDRHRRTESEITTQSAGALRSVLAPESPIASLNVALDGVLLEGNRLLDLLKNNRDPLYGNVPISGPKRESVPIWFGLLDLDPRDARYVDNVRRLAAAYPHAQIQDNLELESAKANTDRTTRIRLLEACIRKFPGNDAIPEALFHLAVAYKDDGRLRDCESAFSRLANAHPASIWTRQADRHVPFSASALVTKLDR